MGQRALQGERDDDRRLERRIEALELLLESVRRTYLRNAASSRCPSAFASCGLRSASLSIVPSSIPSRDGSLP